VKNPTEPSTGSTPARSQFLAETERSSGIAGITRDLKKMHSANVRFLSLAPVVETILSDYAQSLVGRFLGRQSVAVGEPVRSPVPEEVSTTPRKYITNVRITTRL
jgi:hypothetical protein